MGNPVGFLEHTRQLPEKQPAGERLRHYREFVEFYAPEQLQRQSGRCMNCGVPFCHHGCPLGNLIPEFNDAVYRGQWQQAYEILASTNDFPEFTGRICPAPCESACVLGINQPPVVIEEIERHIIEIAFGQGWVKPCRITHRSGKKVAVVGSGPAGLAAAAQLNMAGHSVTVFERDDAPGGLLRYGIPDFKLEKRVIDRRIHLLESEGVLFRCNTEVGKDLTTSELAQDFDAVVLTIGCSVPRDLELPGRHLEGVLFAMDYLKAQNKAVREGQTGRGPASGRQVVVIGGGDTGSDCVGTANRQGALSVSQLELLPVPPAVRLPHMPWPSYPLLLKTSSSHEEGCERQWAVLTKAFLGDAEGRLRALQVVDLEWQTGENGAPAQFCEIPGTEREIPCELVLLALGFLHPRHDGLVSQLEIALSERGNLFASDRDFQTSAARIFTAGDARRGQSLVVWAIAEGRECARKVDEFLAQTA